LNITTVSQQQLGTGWLPTTPVNDNLLRTAGRQRSNLQDRQLRSPLSNGSYVCGAVGRRASVTVLDDGIVRAECMYVTTQVSVAESLPSASTGRCPNVRYDLPSGKTTEAPELTNAVLQNPRWRLEHGEAVSRVAR
jgi:hypothetical protein